MDLEERFWSKVNILGEDDCWEWQAGSRGGRYGAFRFRRKTIDSHRMVWYLLNGEFPELLVCHSCDNNKCCNPKHLFLGTYKDNHDDMVSKNRKTKRFPKGTSIWTCKLSEKDVLEIRKKYKSGKYTQKELAKKFNIARTTVSNITKNVSWKHI